MAEIYAAEPILNILVPHTGHFPSVAGRPFFIVIWTASLISRFALHFTQYASAATSGTSVGHGYSRGPCRFPLRA